MSQAHAGLPEALERAASALPDDADAIRPANGDPVQLARALDDEGARRVLGWLLAHEPAAGEELAAAWAEDPEGAGRAVLALEPEDLPKAARKALRRVRHRLRSRGHALAEAERPQLVASLPPLDDSLQEARVGPIDPRGTRAVYLASDHPSGGVRLFEVLLDPALGVLEFEVYSSGRRRVRRFLRELEGGPRAAPAPPDSVRALIARAAAAQPGSRPLPRGFAEWRSRLCEVPPQARTPGELARESLGDTVSEESEALRRIEELVRSRALGPWPPSPERARAVAARVAEAGRGVLTVSDAARREQRERALEEACEEVYDAPTAEATAVRLEESAYLWWKEGREADARAALAVARRFRAGAPRENPVAQAMLEIWLAPALRDAPGETESAEAGDAPEASRLVTP